MRLPRLSDTSLAILVAFLIFLILPVVFLRPSWDVDIFWHIMAGRWIIEHISLPHTDIFSYTDPLRPWHSFQWAYEVFTALLDKAGGIHLVRLVHMGLFGMAMALFFFFAWKKSRSWALSFFAFAILLIAFFDRVRVRPDVFNLLFLAMALPSLLMTTQWSWKRRLALFVLGFLWASFHGGGVLLLIFGSLARLFSILLFYYLSDRSLLRSAFLDILSLLGPLLSPGYLPGVYQAFFMLDASREFIPEWIPTLQYFFQHASAFSEKITVILALLPSLLLFFFMLFRVRGWKPDAIIPILLSIMFIVLALRHIRFLWLGAIPLFLPLFVSHMPPMRFFTGYLRWGLVVISFLLSTFPVWRQVQVFSGGIASHFANFRVPISPKEFPLEAAEFLTQANVSGDIFNHPPWGGYLLWALGPNSKVFSDGRGNFSQAEADIIRQLEKISLRREAIENSLGMGIPTLLIHPRPFPLDDYNRAHWMMIYRDAQAQVFLNLHAPQASAIIQQVSHVLGKIGFVHSDSPNLWPQTLSDFFASRDSRILSLPPNFSQRANPQQLLALMDLYHQTGHYLKCLDLVQTAAHIHHVSRLYWNARCLAGIGQLTSANSLLAQLLSSPDFESLHPREVFFARLLAVSLKTL